MRELLARGAAVDAAANDGATPLLIASQEGHLEVVREFISRGADPRAATFALLAAIEAGHMTVAGLLRRIIDGAQ